MKKLLGSLLLMLLAYPTFSQQWRYTGAMSIPKQEFTMTALNNGKVLVTGGLNGDDQARAECELYDPATESWTITNPLNVARTLHTAVKLHDGRIAVFGGQIGNVMTSVFQTAQVELFDPLTNIWSDGGRLQLPREHQTTTLLPDGRVFIAAGLTGSTPTAQCEIYDPLTKTSAFVAPLKLARYEQQAAALSDGRIMVSGGRDGGWDGNYFKESEIYDPASDSWTVLPNMNQSRQRGLLVQFSDGSILTAAGRNSSESSAPGSELFNLSNNTWTPTDPMKLPCTWMAPVLLPDDRYLVTGGFYDANWTSSTNVTCTSTTEWYDQQNALWYFAPEMEQARGRHQAVYLHQSVNEALPTDLVLVAGGITGNDSYTSSCEVLDVGYGALESYRLMPANTAATASITEDLSSNFVRIFHNENVPVVEYSTTGAFVGSIELTDLEGRRIALYDATVSNAGVYDLSLNTTALSNGIYFARCTIGKTFHVLKVIVMR